MYSGDPWDTFRAAAACLILGFGGGIAAFCVLIATLTGAMAALTGGSLKVSVVSIAAWTWAWTLVGTIVGGSKVRP